jgi:hypothetical protein
MNKCKTAQSATDPQSARNPGTVRLIRVFVSSPGDVQTEREALEKAVVEINRTEARRLGVMLQTFRWEKDVVPKIGPPPQDVVDEQTPACDIYLGIMAARFGTPTDGYGSGTEKEFNDAVKRWGKAGSPWILFYFHSNPPSPKTSKDVTQFGKVVRFRERLQKMGIVGQYDSVDKGENSFLFRVRNHLGSILGQLPIAQGGQPEPATPSGTVPARPTIPPAYLDWLKSQCAGIDLEGLKVQQGQAVTLSHVYVPLTTPAERTVEAARSGDTLREDQPAQLLLESLAKDNLYVAGAAGSGKSTFCRWVAWLACEGKMPETTPAAPEEYRERFPSSFAGRLPLLVRLRDFWTCLPETPGCCDMSQAELEDSLARWVDARKQGGLTWEIVQPHLQNGSLLLILDGLDEVPLTHGDTSTRRPSQPRAMLVSALVASLRAWTERGNRVILTSRPYGLDENHLRRMPLKSAPLSELDEPVRQLLLQRWFHCLVQSPEKAESTAQEMLQHVAQRADLGELTANPMLLTAMCIVYHDGGRLPQHRYDLYNRIVDNVLFHRFPEDREVIDPVRNRLAVVAYGMHTGEGLGEARTTPQAEATYAEIDRMIQAYQDQRAGTEAGYTNAVAAREQLLTRTGLFLPRGDNRAGFYHFTFQDFFAAQRLLDLRGDSLFEEFLRRGAVPEWRNTLSFVLGSQLAKHTSPDRSIILLGQLVESLNEQTLGLSVVVAECFQILLKRGLRLKSESEEKFRQYCLSAIEREVPVRERHELGLALGHLGDPRIEADLRVRGRPEDHRAYVRVPAGKYFFGEKKRAITIKEDLWFSRYPVTNSQYRPFMDDGGYGKAEFWPEEGWKWKNHEQLVEPRLWRHAKWNAPNQPVVCVSYFEAEAFARWAGGRLPTEKEWEAVTRGPEGYEYPWGNEWRDGVCNSDEAGLGITSPVGIFLRSRSKPFGLEDMAGNVWEWCESWHDQDKVCRVIRGGSWSGPAENCRCSFRDWGRPAGRGFNLGFRLVFGGQDSSHRKS